MARGCHPHHPARAHPGAPDAAAPARRALRRPPFRVKHTGVPGSKVRGARRFPTVGLPRNRRPRPTAALLAGVTALTGAVVTLAVLALPFLELAYEAPALHVMLETLN